MALMNVILIAFLEIVTAVKAATTPVSVHLGDNATFSWPLPASARGKLVLVVGPTGACVLSWAPDCTVTPFSDFADRVRSSCKDASQVTFTLLGVRWTDEGSYTCEAVSSFWSSRIEDCGQELTVIKDRPFPQPEVSHYGMPVLGQPFSMSCIDNMLHQGIPSQAMIERDGDGYRAEFEIPRYDGLILIQHPNSYIVFDWHPPCQFSFSLAFQQRVTNTSCDPCKRTLSFSLSSLTERDLGRYQCYAGTTHGTKIDSCSVDLITKAQRLPPAVTFAICCCTHQTGQASVCRVLSIAPCSASVEERAKQSFHTEMANISS